MEKDRIDKIIGIIRSLKEDVGAMPTNNISGAGPTDSANVLRAYKFIDIFPTSVSEIALSYDTENAIEEFTVEFQVQYFEAFGAKEAADIR